MPIMVWIFTLAMLTTRWVHLQNSCAILKNRRYSLHVHCLMGVERHPFMRQCLQVRRFVCHHCRKHPKSLFVRNLCLQLSTFNLIIVPKTTNVDTYFVFGLCLWQKVSSRRCLCLS